ncbi:MAG: hypothetical protein AAF380_02880, partial [Bacteroidota bacterium]
MKKARKEFEKNKTTYLQALETEKRNATMDLESSKRYLEVVFIALEKKIEQENEEDETEINQLKKEITKLGSGTHRDNLRKIYYPPETTMTVYTVKPGARAQQHKEFRLSKMDDYIEGSAKEITIKDYKGNLLEDIIISRNYNLMKKDKATGIFQELTDYKEGKYKAIV